jgi:hypothetical protein
MANITITFTNPLPDGIQIGDIAWYSNATSGVEVEMGPITAITGNPITISINAAAGVQPPSISDFVFYVKNPMTTVSSLKGYYAEAQFRNNSLAYGELFSVGSEVFVSSK